MGIWMGVRIERGIYFYYLQSIFTVITTNIHICDSAINVEQKLSN